MSGRRYVDKPALSAEWTPGDAATNTRRKHESPDLGAAAASMMRALVRRAAEGDTEALEELLELEAVVARSTVEASRVLHAAGYSWTDIAAVTGTTRQAARQRFGLPSLLPEALLGGDELDEH